MRASVALMILVTLSLTSCARAPKVEARLAKQVEIATTICRRATPVLKVAAYFPSPELPVIVASVDAMCAPLLAGVVPETFDVSTASWLERNLLGVVARLPR